MTMSKKEIMEKDLKSIMAKDIGAKNPIFSPAHISELHAVFALYCDTRLRRTDVRDIILTATTLGLNDTYNMALRVLEDISDANSGNALDFEGFVRELTNRIGNPFDENGRKATFNMLDLEGKGELDFKDLRYMNEQLRYGFDEMQLVEIIHAVGGYNAQTISWDKFNQYVRRRVHKKDA